MHLTHKCSTCLTLRFSYKNPVYSCTVHHSLCTYICVMLITTTLHLLHVNCVKHTIEVLNLQLHECLLHFNRNQIAFESRGKHLCICLKCLNRQVKCKLSTYCMKHAFTQVNHDQSTFELRGKHLCICLKCLNRQVKRKLSTYCM